MLNSGLVDFKQKTIVIEEAIEMSIIKHSFIHLLLNSIFLFFFKYFRGRGVHNS